MINHLTTAQSNGLLGKALKVYVRPSLLLLDELGYPPIDNAGPICCSRWSLPVMIRIDRADHESNLPGMGHPV